MADWPAFLSVDLAFGRHSHRWELPPDRPVLIAGRNGSGKTTIVDGMLRAVFGFNRKRPAESALCDARRPWRGEEFRSTVRLRTPGGDVLRWSRDHLTDEVSVRREAGESLFRGTANPGSTGSGDGPYWALVQEVFGVTGLDGYARTAFVGQGSLLDTPFGTDLLRLAEGGHARLQAALEKIEARHRELTREPVSAGGRRLNTDRALEHDRRALADLDRELARAREARDERDAIDLRLAEVNSEATRQAMEIERLERARSRLAERAGLDAEAEAAGQRLDRLAELRDQLDTAQRDVRAADHERALHAEHEAIPDDFPARVERLRSAWEDEARHAEAIAAGERELAATNSRGSGTAVPATAGLLAIAAVMAALVLDPAGPLRPALLLVATAGIAVAVLAAWRKAGRDATRSAMEAVLARERRELDAVRHRMRAALDGVPDARGLTPASAAEGLRDFQRARAAMQRLEEARRRHHEAVRRVEESAEARAAPGRPLALLISDAERDLAEIRVRRSQLERDEPPDADSLPPTIRGVDDALRKVRSRLDELREEREELRIRLDRAARASADLSRLERERGDVDRRIADAEAACEALHRAHALLIDGYDAFRDHDEARLVDAISKRLELLGDPALGPFRTEGGLGKPTVGLGDRRLPIDSLGLSHGQRHLVMLAIRLGAADFLAAEGVAAPLIVDEPFAHLDDRHAAQVWALLERVAEQRQVVVSTQETRLLERLGVEATIRLPERMSNGGPPARPLDEDVEDAVGAAETGGLDATS